MDLTKQEKKIAREVIEIGLQKEISKALFELDAILNDWKTKRLDNQDAWHKLYKKITSFDKYLARRYDGMSGSNYLLIIIGQLRDGIISESDLENFSGEIRLMLKQFVD